MTAMNVFFAGVPVSTTRQHARGTSVYLGFVREVPSNRTYLTRWVLPQWRQLYPGNLHQRLPCKTASSQRYDPR
jgi:hypothetical protein